MTKDPEAMDLEQTSTATRVVEDSLPTTPQPQGTQQDEIDLQADANTQHNMIKSNGVGAKAHASTNNPTATASLTTPPPSSQIAPPARMIARTPTPPSPHLSSPPPTNIITKQPGPLSEGSGAIFSKNEVATASSDRLRSMVDELSDALRDARMSAAHHKLQYNMLRMESTEMQNRMEVELAMRERDLDEYMRRAEQREEDVRAQLPDSDAVARAALQINELRKQNQYLESENESLNQRISHANRVIEDRDESLREEREKTRNLQRQIRKNREHVNSMLETPFDGSPTRSILGTPITPRSRGIARTTEASARRDQQPFEALLLADKVLRQETTTAPSTPTRGQQRQRYSHQRGVHSMSSMPSTPNRPRPQYSGLLETPPHRQLFNQIPMSAPQPQHYIQQTRPRRTSSASTITASSVDNEYSDDDAIPESQASREASSILRKTPTSKSFEAAQKSGGLVQSKIFGQVRKAANSRPDADQDKRRASGKDAVAASPSKKRRYEHVGLGIGGVAR